MYKKLSTEILCQNSSSPRLPKEYLFKRFNEWPSMFSARFSAAFSIFLSSVIGDLHLMKNVEVRNVAMKNNFCFKLAANVGAWRWPIKSKRPSGRAILSYNFIVARPARRGLRQTHCCLLAFDKLPIFKLCAFKKKVIRE